MAPNNFPAEDEDGILHKIGEFAGLLIARSRKRELEFEVLLLPVVRLSWQAFVTEVAAAPAKLEAVGLSWAASPIRQWRATDYQHEPHQFNRALLLDRGDGSC